MARPSTDEADSPVGEEKRELESNHSEGEDDTLTVSFEDIGALRRSLERDGLIRESLASTRNSNVSHNRSMPWPGDECLQ